MREKEAERWLSILTNLGRAPNTILAYRRALDDYLDFCTQQQKRPQDMDREQISLFVRSMAERPMPGKGTQPAASRSGLAHQARGRDHGRGHCGLGGGASAAASLA